MEKTIQLPIGSVIGWHGKKYRVAEENLFGCHWCDLRNECEEVPFKCCRSERTDGKGIRFVKLWAKDERGAK